MPRPKDFTPSMERRRKRLARKLEGKRGIANPWALATWQVRRQEQAKKRGKRRKRRR